jgi:hypothetical protein
MAPSSILQQLSCVLMPLTRRQQGRLPCNVKRANLIPASESAMRTSCNKGTHLFKEAISPINFQ